jgi:hypothetical protein
MICLPVRFDVTVHGSLILVMQRFAGQEEYAWYLIIQLVGIKVLDSMVSCVPARVDVVKASAVPEVRSINGKLIVCVKLGFHGVVAGPWVTGAAFQNEHPVIDSRTVERTECVDFGRWSV